MVAHLEEPLAHPVMGTTYFLARFVREHVKVTLIGEGSDELFGGYPHYRLFAKPFSWVPAGVRRRQFFAAACLMPDAATLRGLIAPAWLDHAELERVAGLYDGYFAGKFGPDEALRWEVEQELVYSQLARIDRLTMAHSVEARVPFLDRAFAELALSMPFELNLRGGVHKHALRRAVADLLPPEVVHRPKTGRRGTQSIMADLATALRPRLVDALRRPDGVGSLLRVDTTRDYLAGANSRWTRYHPIEGRRRVKFALAVAILDRWARLFPGGGVGAAGASVAGMQ